MAGQKTDDRDAYIGQRIAEERRRASLTQRRVAQSFGMSAAQLQKYEKGTNRISAVHLEIFARMTGVPLEHFFQGMKRLDDIPPQGFGEDKQQEIGGGDLQALVDVLARHLSENVSDETRRDIAAAVHALDRKLNG
ncbi:MULTISPECIES: helix-turn-helix domain-containing protein [Methylobacterium]|uniref:helix-turn-helix domain-containing protein n=1 Tax=Methylobacterium TaxID=407 RepID=UPI001051B872|nr:MULTISPECIES: helix-turn-helix transcriptional regulator [Methylobacterium]MDR7038739.1 transcriptional regulator with XRE-family HTH domain [Methylobacterium sp. BE186]